MKNLWYKDAIIYSLDVETFMDANGDGIGDFIGLTKRLNHLAGLGVTCLWLLPFYPSPNRDNGYDVMDYYNVDPRLGTLGDFVEFMHQARDRGIRVIVDLVVNHTSNQHPWFQSARSDKNSKYRHYYVWTDHSPQNAKDKVAFPGVQESIWEYDEQAGAYYLHRFYKEQPDLNTANPEVREEIRKIMGFWLELGVSGFRIDAAPYLIEPLGIEDAKLEELHNLLSEMREFVSERHGEGVLLAEANVPQEKIPLYFGDGDRMQMLFNFLLNQDVFLALAREQAAPIIEGLKTLPNIPPTGQWVNFLRHHDELTLDQLTKEEQQEIFAAFAPDETMQIYGHGIRRRLPPMLGGERRHLELAYSLLFSLPGTPLLRYGDEIGMGDDLSLEDRTSVRTPMQWSNTQNGGFSTAPQEALTLPVISAGEYGYQQVNAITQQRDSNSLLNWIERVIRIRQQCPELGRGECGILETDEPSVFAHCCQWESNTVVAVHNLAKQPCTVTLKSKDFNPKHLIEIFRDQQYEPLDENSLTIPLGAYGYRWFRADSLV
ncbi:MAG TPA: trehalose synthase [Cyanobacteria bacterium UBA11162]|nr:trehalose synthase [Cyanobacteria bacterium UBA11162]